MSKICQSCAMIMNPSDHGQNSDGSISEEYCKYCFANGKFIKEETMEEKIESNIPFWLNDTDCQTADDAKAKMMGIFPFLKRWKH